MEVFFQEANNFINVGNKETSRIITNKIITNKLKNKTCNLT